MSLEDQVAALTSAANALTATVQNKIGEIDAAVAAMGGTVQAMIGIGRTEAHYYVDAVSGDDGNDGAQNSPFATFDRALRATTDSRKDYVAIYLKQGQTFRTSQERTLYAYQAAEVFGWGGPAELILAGRAYFTGYFQTQLSAPWVQFHRVNITVEQPGDGYSGMYVGGMWVYQHVNIQFHACDLDLSGPLIWAMKPMGCLILETSQFYSGGDVTIHTDAPYAPHLVHNTEAASCTGFFTKDDGHYAWTGKFYDQTGAQIADWGPHTFTNLIFAGTDEAPTNVLDCTGMIKASVQ